jgi:NADH:ubiquinone oxidoreductase subunit F (NADH-binding)
VADAPGGPKYAVCNADESEPGTFKDRALLEGAPHLVLEGLLVGAVVVGATEAIVYLRHEYRRAHAALERTLRRLEADGLAGPGSASGVALRLFESPGGYICGEETALLEALEGRRAEPRNKPPYPGTHGLHGKPTLVNNVETLAFVAGILVAGADWYRSVGANGSTGRKLLALSGDVARPGVYAVPLGTTARDLIEGQGGGVAGGRRLKAFSPGGPSSGFLPASMADVPLDFGPLAKVGSMLGSGAVVALAEGRCLLDAARSYVGFFEAESCGKCVPCRVGTQKLSARLARWADRGQAGAPPPEIAGERAMLDDLAVTMGQASICGLGQVAALPIMSALRHFREEVEAHLVEGRCPDGVCAGGPR